MCLRYQRDCPAALLAAADCVKLLMTELPLRLLVPTTSMMRVFLLPSFNQPKTLMMTELSRLKLLTAIHIRNAHTHLYHPPLIQTTQPTVIMAQMQQSERSDIYVPSMMMIKMASAITITTKAHTRRKSIAAVQRCRLRVVQFRCSIKNQCYSEYVTKRGYYLKYARRRMIVHHDYTKPRIEVESNVIQFPFSTFKKSNLTFD